MADWTKTRWSHEAISAVNDLIQTCKDGEQGFKTAAEAVRDPEFQQLFLRYSQERHEFARELQDAVRLAGGDPETSGSVSGALHRGWIDFKAAVTSDDRSVIGAAESGEDSAVKAYRDALARDDLPADVRALVERQYLRVKEAHDRVRALRDRLAA